MKAEQGLLVPFFRIFCLSNIFTLYGMILIKVLAINLGTTMLNVITKESLYLNLVHVAMTLFATRHTTPDSERASYKDLSLIHI